MVQLLGAESGRVERTPMATWLRLTKLIVIGEEERGAEDVWSWGLERSIISWSESRRFCSSFRLMDLQLLDGSRNQHAEVRREA